MLKQYGYVRVGAIVNETRLADVNYNVNEIKRMLDKAIEEGVEIVTFPELSITGYTCQDLFLTDDLLNQTLNGLNELKEYSKTHSIVFIVGAPLRIEDALYNCAVSFSDGKVIGVTVKTYVPNYSEFYEYRYFSSATNLKVSSFMLNNEEVPVSNFLLYHCKNHSFITYGVEICEDLWMSNSPSNILTTLGANIIFNLSSSNELVGKYEYRRSLVKMSASKQLSAYVYASTGLSESTSDLLFSGHAMIAEPSGKPVENKRFDFHSNLIFQDVDLFKINHDRIKKRTYKQFSLDIEPKHTYFSLATLNHELKREYSKTPFVSEKKESLDEIINIQSYALAKRIRFLNNTKMVIGVSGGSDSTLAFLICLKACDILNMDHKEIIAITMPGLGTSNRTFENAKKLISSTGATYKEISIKDACLLHYKDIHHDPHNYDITYENVQARERTQILFDVANQEGGIVIGTGDLSEIALGWATYNGDHMSHYSVNSSIPKTLVTRLIAHLCENTSNGVLKETLLDILDTPISPELLPLDEQGFIAQKSESSIGPYILHDFFLYHFFRYGVSVKKIYFMACHTFKELKCEDIKKYLIIFVKRFFSQQFKRDAMPDGVKVGTIALSPRGDLRMSSDTYATMYLKELEEL